MINLLWCTIRTGNFPNVYKIWFDRTKQKENVKCHVLVSTQNEATFLNQYFDDIYCYSRALSAVEVVSVYNHGNV